MVGFERAISYHFVQEIIIHIIAPDDFRSLGHIYCFIKIFFFNQDAFKASGQDDGGHNPDHHMDIAPNEKRFFADFIFEQIFNILGAFYAEQSNHFRKNISGSAPNLSRFPALAARTF